MKSLLMILSICCLGLLSCTDTKTSESKPEPVANHEPGEETAAKTFVCPMKCEGDKTYPAAGNCPVCKMDLTASN